MRCQMRLWRRRDSSRNDKCSDVIHSAGGCSSHVRVGLLAVQYRLGRLRERPECVVGTVGRLIDFIENEKHWFGVRNVRFLILDEADAMIGEGLDANIRKITCDVETPRRQTMLFSATFADDVSDLATWISRHAVEDPLRANRDVKQEVIIVKDEFDKEGALKSTLRKVYSAHNKSPGKVLIFAFDHDECDSLAKKVKAALNGVPVETLHGYKKQAERETAMQRFRNGDSWIMVATSIAGRGSTSNGGLGITMQDITLVINFDPPEEGSLARCVAEPKLVTRNCCPA
eukprot:s1030_g14.t1